MSISSTFIVPLQFIFNETISLKLPITFSETIKIGSSLSVSYNLGLREEELDNEIRLLSNPKVIFWYIDNNGLRNGSVNFYRNKISKILQLVQSECILYDLKAWSAFADDKRNITESFEGDVCRINNINKGSELYSKLKCKKTCDFFQWMLQEANQGIISYVKNKIFARECIFAKSKEYLIRKKIQPQGKLVEQLFPMACSMISEKILKRYAVECYSAFQYVEGIYLIMDAVEQALIQGQSDINFIFALPNDEAEYYLADVFPDDLNALLQAKFGDKIVNFNINIYFKTFLYADGSSDSRPYKKGKVIKKYERK